jgi:hypothetical protein
VKAASAQIATSAGPRSCGRGPVSAAAATSAQAAISATSACCSKKPPAKKASTNAPHSSATLRMNDARIGVD